MNRRCFSSIATSLCVLVTMVVLVPVPTHATHCVAHITLVSTSTGCGSDEEGSKEAWLATIENYPAGEDDLPNCGANGPDIKGELDAAGGWTTVLTENTLTLESHFKSSSAGGSDNVAADASDFAYFCGHGNKFGSDPDVNSVIQFHNTVEFEDLYSWESEFGDVDLEWVTWDASHSLWYDDTNNNQNMVEWHAAFKYLHLIVGWHSTPYDTDGGFQFFDEMIDHSLFDGGGHKIKTAWFDGFGGCSGNIGKHQSILSEDPSFGDDYIHGQGSGAQDDLAHDSTYTLWRNEC